MIIFDLDGTLADCEHRRHFVDIIKSTEDGYLPAIEVFGHNIKSEQRGGYYHPQTKNKWKPDWKRFFESCNEDSPIWPVVRVIESLCLNNVTIPEKEIQIWSGRCESVRDRTEHWLKYIIGEHTYSLLKMRPIGDNTADDILKEMWLDEALRSGKKIDFVFDDRPKVVRMWRKRGIFVFDVNQSGKEF